MANLVPGMEQYTTTLSSAGLIYAHYGKAVLAAILHQPENSTMIEKLFDKIYEKFVEEVDAIDNGIPVHDEKVSVF